MGRITRQLATATLVLALGCGPTTYTRLGREPFHDTRAQFDADARDGRTTVVVTLRELPPPSRIASSLTHYVLWLVAPGQEPVRAGVFTYDAQRRLAVGRGRARGERLTVVVTAEAGATPERPSETVVVEQTVVGG